MDAGHMIVEFISWTIVAAIVVLVVMNASKFKIAVGSVGGFWTSETKLLTGSGYK